MRPPGAATSGQEPSREGATGRCPGKSRVHPEAYAGSGVRAVTGHMELVAGGGAMQVQGIT